MTAQTTTLYYSASGLFAEYGIPNGKAVIRNLIYKFITRLNESTNDVISAILSSDIRLTSRIRHYWVKTLYVHHDLVRCNYNAKLSIMQCTSLV